MNNISQTGCCPKFDPAPWDDKIFEWKNKTFVKDKVFTLFYMPMNFGRVITRLIGKVQNAGVSIPDWLCLSDHTSKWNMDIYLATEKEVAGAENVAISGRYRSKVYEGDFKETGKWCKDFGTFAKAKGVDIRKQFMWYTTCPKCAKIYGKNFVVIIGEVQLSI